jgi:hypothetical protein
MKEKTTEGLLNIWSYIVPRKAPGIAIPYQAAADGMLIANAIQITAGKSVDIRDVTISGLMSLGLHYMHRRYFK